METLASILGISSIPTPVRTDALVAPRATPVPAPVGPDPALLEVNLRAIAQTSPETAERLRLTAPRDDLRWSVVTPQTAGAAAAPGQTAPDAGGPAQTGPVLSASIEHWTPTGTKRRNLASQRDPWTEARRLVESFDPVECPVAAVIGLGLGYQLAVLGQKLRKAGLVLVYEPDLGLLRAVCERLPLHEWMAQTNAVILSEDSEGAIATALRGAEPLVVIGTRLIPHPPSQVRLEELPDWPGPDSPRDGERAPSGAVATRFAERFVGVVNAIKTTITTTLVQSEATLRNALQNVDHYAAGPSLAGWGGSMPEAALAGRPAVVVSAGPSLERNVHLLARPGVRDRVCIIAVQTALKPLLARGIRPHLVTALDYHEISRRFYEGLSAADVAGVTLVVEPKVNPAVTSAFPGVIRCAGDEFLDRVLGPDFVGQDPAKTHPRLPPGATVAHLAYYLARFLGADPVALIGQDLAFSDGQYYAAGAAIHHTWAAELNPFRTLEMMEWERIVRARGILRRGTDHAGRSIYTDEQMATYLVQFQRDFKADQHRGLTTIDATEGGIRKDATQAMTLERFLAQHAPETGGTSADGAPKPTIDELLSRASRGGSGVASPAEPSRTLGRVGQRLRTLRQDCWRLESCCRTAADLLEEMLQHQRDQSRVNRLIDRVNKVRDDATRIQPAFDLVERLNQLGAFNRYRADRRIYASDAPDGVERQRAQILRDQANVRWLGDAARAMASLLDGAAAAVSGAPKQTREPAPDGRSILDRAAANALPGALARADEADTPGPPGTRTAITSAPTATVHAVITLDTGFDGTGRPRGTGGTIGRGGSAGAPDGLAAPLADGLNSLQLTLRRLARVQGVRSATIITDDANRARELLGRATPAGLRIEIDEAALGERGWTHRTRRGARAFSPACWRGGLGNASIFDEILWPAATLRALRKADADAALLLGADWCLFDPNLATALIARYGEHPAANKFTFTQAAPGLAPAVVDRSVLEQISLQRPAAGSFASLGGLLGYVPTAPLADLIAKPQCVPVEVPTRDAGQRFIADATGCGAAIARGLRSDAATPEILAAARAAVPLGPALVNIDVGGPAPGHTSGTGAAWLTPETLARTLAAVMSLGGPAPAVTLTSRRPAAAGRLDGPDALDHPAWFDLLAAVREATDHAAAVHLRTSLLPILDDESRAKDALARLLAVDGSAGIDVLSVDVLSTDANLYAALTGQTVQTHARLMAALDWLVRNRAACDTGVPTPWIVPRIAKRDAALSQIEAFYDWWTLVTGAAVIDAAPTDDPRLRPLPWPPALRDRAARTVLCIGPDGRATPAINPADLGGLPVEHPAGRGAPSTTSSADSDLAAGDPAVIWARVLASRATAADGP